MGFQRNCSFCISEAKLCSDTVIILPDSHKPSLLQCDANGHSIGAVWMQDGKVVAYESKLLQDAKISMNIYEEELLSLVHALTI